MATSPPVPAQTGQQDLQFFSNQAVAILVWLVIGFTFLWIISFLGEVVLERLKPVIMFIVAAVLVGVVVGKALSKV